MVTKTGLENVEWERVKIEEDPLGQVYKRYRHIVNTMYERINGFDPNENGSTNSLFATMVFYVPNNYAYYHPLGVSKVVMMDEYGKVSQIRITFSCAQNSCFADDLNYLRGRRQQDVGLQADGNPLFCVSIPEVLDTPGEKLEFDIDMYLFKEEINPYLLHVLREEFEGKGSDGK